MHLLVNVKCRNQELLTSTQALSEWIPRMVKHIKMNIIAGPFCIQYPDPGGITGVAMLAESHISVHTYPEVGMAYVDIFSCAKFDFDSALRMIKSDFKVEEVTGLSLLDRGDLKEDGIC